jgi:nucleoside-diphosphate-sugar epimerase
VRALVTGAAGFIGSHLCERLLADGASVVGLDCFTDYYPRAVKEANLAALWRDPRFTLVESRIQDAELPRLLDSTTHVFHLAAQAGVRKSWGRDFRVYTENNVEATQVLLEACAAARLERLVYASSSSVYGDEGPIPFTEDQRPAPVSPYGVTKLAAEHLCHLYGVNHGVPAVALRYFTVYGPRQRPDMAFHRFFTAAWSGRPIPIYGDGEQTRDFTFVADAVAATVAAGARGVPGRVYNIGGGSRVTVAHVLTLVGRLVGHPLQLAREAPQKGDMRDTYADTSRARADLGYVPSVTLEQGLEAEYRWLAATPSRAVAPATSRHSD